MSRIKITATTIYLRVHIMEHYILLPFVQLSKYCWFVPIYNVFCRPGLAAIRCTYFSIWSSFSRQFIFVWNYPHFFSRDTTFPNSVRVSLIIRLCVGLCFGILVASPSFLETNCAVQVRSHKEGTAKTERERRKVLEIISHCKNAQRHAPFVLFCDGVHVAISETKEDWLKTRVVKTCHNGKG